MAETLASASTSTSASPHSNSRYDIFINHRGPDVKKTLASHIYRRLLSYGWQAFLDHLELQRGESLTPQIKGAIATASVHVAIFSPRYAESRWCLDELVLMLESKKSGAATIIPVFYNVNPSDLRWTDKGMYAQALLHHKTKRRYDQQTIANWKKALSEVSHISGFTLEDCNGDEGELVDKVAQRVQKKVRKPPLHVAIHPTGLDDKLHDFEKTVLLEQQQGRGRRNAVGIVGHGGLGKTTLAKVFFNRKRSDYNTACFLSDVREAAAKKSLSWLQRKLYKDLTGQDQSMDSVDEGIAMLKYRLSACGHALIVLDDVDDVEQLDVLLSPVKDVLPSGSLIIVTSRNQEVLTTSGIGVSSIYKMTVLDEEHSQVLFCLHAFSQCDPVVGFEEVVRKFLKVCAGLPLALKVLGSQHHGKQVEYWNAQLRKISKSGLPTDIRSRLKISYDSLEKEEKEIFLDIACFFIGMKRDTAIRIWDGSDWGGCLSLLNLENKCLVEIDSENCLRMHDHLRDMGRDLAAQESPLGCGLRLWRPTDELFRNLPPQSTVRGITIVQQKSGESFQIPAEFSNSIVDMNRLQLLRAPGDCLESILKLMIRQPDLLWLCWERYSDSQSPLPSWIPIGNLRVLQLPREWSLEIRPLMGTLWNMENEAPLQLRELTIGWSLFRLPESIGQLKHLEKIELHNFRGISLPEEFFLLTSLKHLRLSGDMLSSLPDSLGNLTNLDHIDLSECGYLQTLPHSFGNLRKLQHVNLAFCMRLEMLPDSFSNLIRLKHLNLEDCFELTLSSETLGNINTLERVNFSDCYKIEVLPPQVIDQRSLEELSFYCRQLKALPSAIGYLSNLEILALESPSIEILPPSLCNLTNLKELRLDETPKLKDLPDSVGDLKQLTSLSIFSAGIEYLPFGVRQLNNLERLSVQNCPIRQVPFAGVEKIDGGGRLLDSSIDKCMLRLRQLSLTRARITELSFGEGVCPNLQGLDLSWCGDLVEVGALPTTLMSLQLVCCRALKRIRGLPGLAKLRGLNMRGCRQVEELPGLETLISLENFGTSKCENMDRIQVLVGAENPESDILKRVIELMVTDDEW